MEAVSQSTVKKHNYPQKLKFLYTILYEHPSILKYTITYVLFN